MKRVKIIRYFNSNKKTTRLSNTPAYPSLGPRPRLEFALRVCHLQTSVTTRIWIYFPVSNYYWKDETFKTVVVTSYWCPPSWNGETIETAVGLSCYRVHQPALCKVLSDSVYPLLYEKRTKVFACVRDRHIINIHKSICKASFGFSGEWDVKICKHYSIQTKI